MDAFSRVIRRALLILGIGIILMIVGSMIGYAIGGGNPFAVFVPSTWGHIIDFLK
ncbi:DNA-directed RNA polymerase subunit beta [Lacticaseibacillus hulanensis]|uniref:DNA-directed RNA polymerase subunit beta n=1 Tax=Lacticaseibacillus hulanensis TaxID=2493111 RepID=UPI000FDA3B5A|nr:DNA-directed RNA polymerase subunit beta [Lacticaseibacillus hulanensis]